MKVVSRAQRWKERDERTADGLANTDGEVFRCETKKRSERDDG